MKKVMIASAALFFAAITSVNAQTTQAPAEKKEIAVAIAQAPVEKKEVAVAAQVEQAQPAKTAVKPEALPDAVKTTIAGEDYKGWVVSSAFLVKEKTEYYELVLTKDKESKTVKIAKDGKLIM